MDIRIIINALIVIFILHIIIINIDYHKNIGTKKNIESFNPGDDKSLSSAKPDTQKSIDFLNNNNTDEDFQKKLLNYAQQQPPVKESELVQKNSSSVAAANTYIGNDNEPNFESNVADISKFYNINYDNLDQNTLQATSIETLKHLEDKPSASCGTNEACDIQPSNVRKSTELPDTWSYKDEMPMNGGSMAGIIGFDSLESQFAMYSPNKMNLEQTKENHFNNVPHNDLRKPVVYEN